MVQIWLWLFCAERACPSGACVGGRANEITQLLPTIQRGKKKKKKENPKGSVCTSLCGPRIAGDMLGAECLAHWRLGSAHAELARCCMIMCLHKTSRQCRISCDDRVLCRALTHASSALWPPQMWISDASILNSHPTSVLTHKTKLLNEGASVPPWTRCLKRTSRSDFALLCCIAKILSAAYVFVFDRKSSRV